MNTADSMDLRPYRRAVAKHYRPIVARRQRLILDTVDAYRNATGKTIYTVLEVVKWAMAAGLMTNQQIYEQAFEDAAHGYLDELCHVSTSPELPFLFHPTRLMRAVETALGECGANEKTLLATVQRRWRELVEAHPDQPFLWNRRLVLTVAKAIRRGELRSKMT